MRYLQIVGAALAIISAVIAAVSFVAIWIPTMAAAMLGFAVGLVLWLVGRFGARNWRAELTTDLPTTLANLADEAARAGEDVRKPSFAPIVFIFYGILGLFWLSAGDEVSWGRPSEWWALLGISVPHIIIFLAGTFYAIRHGEILRMPAWVFVGCAILGVGLPLILLFFPTLPLDPVGR